VASLFPLFRHYHQPLCPDGIRRPGSLNSAGGCDGIDVQLPTCTVDRKQMVAVVPPHGTDVTGSPDDPGEFSDRFGFEAGTQGRTE
jgi:hypothetical protein